MFKPPAEFPGDTGHEVVTARLYSNERLAKLSVHFLSDEVAVVGDSPITMHRIFVISPPCDTEGTSMVTETSPDKNLVTHHPV
jgi:hypothetical protein